MKPPRTLTISEVYDLHGNESVHTEHVAALALQLFDATHVWLRLRRTDRAVLEIAARLHDVGYTTDPVHHAEASAAITLAQPLRGTRASQRQYAAAAMLFHSGHWKRFVADDRVSQLSNPQRAVRLGAILRVADGLDWGHIQDATIVEVRRENREILVKVQASLFPWNVDRANAKADLWNSAMPLPVRFESAEPDADSKQEPLIQEDTHLAETARRLMTLQYKTILANVDGAMLGADIEYLHRIRVAIRRLRALVRLFNKHLPSRLTKPIDEDLTRLGRALGPARDADVWVEIIQNQNRRLGLDKSRRWKSFLEYHLRRQGIRHADVRRCLQSRSFLVFRCHMAELLRVELPRLARKPPPVSWQRFASKHLGRRLKVALENGHLRHRDDVTVLHQLRISLRKARHLAEFVGETLGPRAVKLGRLLKKAEQTLGRIHDIDIALASMEADGPHPPRALMEAFKTERRQCCHEIDKQWHRLESGKFQKHFR
jgi:CHAD domain-containing protein